MAVRKSVRVEGERSMSESLVISRATAIAQRNHPTASGFMVEGYTSGEGTGRSGYHRVTYVVL